MTKKLGGRLEQVLWTVVAGAVCNVVLCSFVSVVMSFGRYFSYPVAVVWVAQLETALWRGAVVGAVIGWWLNSWRATVVASAAGGLVLALLRAVATILEGTRLPYVADVVDQWVVMHFVLNGLSVGAVAGWLVRRAGRASRPGREEVQV